MTEDDSGGKQEKDVGARRFPPKPVKVDEEYEVDVTEISQRGDGIARVDGLVVFVPNTKIGDHVRIRITRISRKFAEAELVEKGEHEKDTGPI